MSIIYKQVHLVALTWCVHNITTYSQPDKQSIVFVWKMGWHKLTYSELSKSSTFSEWKGPFSLCNILAFHLIRSVMPLTLTRISTWSLIITAPSGRRILYISRSISRMSHLNETLIILVRSTRMTKTKMLFLLNSYYFVTLPLHSSSFHSLGQME